MLAGDSSSRAGVNRTGTGGLARTSRRSGVGALAPEVVTAAADRIIHHSIYCGWRTGAHVARMPHRSMPNYPKLPLMSSHSGNMRSQSKSQQSALEQRCNNTPAGTTVPIRTHACGCGSKLGESLAIAIKLAGCKDNNPHSYVAIRPHVANSGERLAKSSS